MLFSDYLGTGHYLCRGGERKMGGRAVLNWQRGGQLFFSGIKTREVIRFSKIYKKSVQES